MKITLLVNVPVCCTVKITLLVNVPVCCRELVECLSSPDPVQHQMTYHQQLMTHLINTINPNYLLLVSVSV